MGAGELGDGPFQRELKPEPEAGPFFRGSRSREPGAGEKMFKLPNTDEQSVIMLFFSENICKPSQLNQFKKETIYMGEKSFLTIKPLNGMKII